MLSSLVSSQQSLGFRDWVCSRSRLYAFFRADGWIFWKVPGWIFWNGPGPGWIFWKVHRLNILEWSRARILLPDPASHILQDWMIRSKWARKLGACEFENNLQLTNIDNFWPSIWPIWIILCVHSILQQNIVALGPGPDVAQVNTRWIPGVLPLVLVPSAPWTRLTVLSLVRLSLMPSHLLTHTVALPGRCFKEKHLTWCT